MSDVVNNRPPLSLVSPLAAKICLIFGIGNILLGMGLFTYKVQLSNFLIINGLTTYQVWGLLFGSLGTASLIFYLLNHWRLLRALLMVGVFMKTFWLIALLYRWLSGAMSNPVVLIIWAMLTALQIVAYIDFVPKLNSDKRHVRD